MRPFRIAVCAGIMFLLPGQFSFAAGPREALKQHVADLQKTPEDNALREKIIQLARQIKPAPAVPEEARKHMKRGEAAFEMATEAKGYELAITEFQAAVNAAPWLASGYFNLATAQEKVGRPAEAVSSLGLYLLADPRATDAEAVKDRVYKLGFLAEQAALEASPERQADRARERETVFMASLDGGLWTGCDGFYNYELRVNGLELTDTVVSSVDGSKLGGIYFKLSLPGRSFDCSATGRGDNCRGTISDDGSKITIDGAYGARGSLVHRRER